MFIDKDSIRVNGVSWGQYLTSAKYEFNKLWGTDTGRNLAGEMNGTLVGIFPKIILKFRKLTVQEMNYIAPILDSSNQEVTYYDPSKNNYETITTYTGDWSYENTRVSDKNGSFECSFIATERRA